MHYFFTLLSFCFLFAFGNEAWAQNSHKSQVVGVLPTTKLYINGEANVKKFTCTFNANYLRRTKKEVRYMKNGNSITFENAILPLANEAFDCGNNAINRDFHLLLKTKEYPQITLELNKVILKNATNGEAYVTITIAGRKKGYSFPVSFPTATKDRFKGRLNLNIRDFNLQPPKKLMGLIVIKENIEISFDLLTQI